MKQLVHNKVVNKSILTDGISLPKDCYELLVELTGKLQYERKNVCYHSY